MSNIAEKVPVSAEVSAEVQCYECEVALMKHNGTGMERFSHSSWRPARYKKKSGESEESGEGGEEENATKELLHMTTLIQTAMDYVSSLKKGQVIQVGYKDGLKYGCRVQQVKLFV